MGELLTSSWTRNASRTLSSDIFAGSPKQYTVRPPGHIRSACMQWLEKTYRLVARTTWYRPLWLIPDTIHQCARTRTFEEIPRLKEYKILSIPKWMRDFTYPKSLGDTREIPDLRGYQKWVLILSKKTYRLYGKFCDSQLTGLVEAHFAIGYTVGH